MKIEKIAEKLNNVEPSINFIYKKESNNAVLFLDILIIKSQYIYIYIYIYIDYKIRK